MEDKERVIYYEVIKELPFAKIGDQGNILTDDEIGVNGIRIPIKYVVDCDFFNPITLKEHEKIIDKNFIKYIMKEKNISEAEAIELKKYFWKIKKLKTNI